MMGDAMTAPAAQVKEGEDMMMMKP